jgi:transcriptional regulator with XRE-family HTH domain
MVQDANGSALPVQVRRSELSEFGKNLKAAMSLADKSIDEIAGELEVSAKTLSRVMRGVREPRKLEIRHLAEVLGVPEAFLVGGFGPNGVALPNRGRISWRLEQIGELRKALDVEEAWLRQLLGGSGSNPS